MKQKHEIRIPTGSLATTYQFLYDMKMKGKAVVDKVKLTKLIKDKVDNYNESIQVLSKEYAILDDNGEAVPDEENEGYYKLAPERTQEYLGIVNELLVEDSVILFGEYVHNFKSIFNALDASEEEFSGAGAVAFAILYEELYNTYGKEEEYND